MIQIFIEKILKLEMLIVQIVNNASDRLTEEQTSALLDTIKSFLPSAEQPSDTAMEMDPDSAAEALAAYSATATTS